MIMQYQIEKTTKTQRHKNEFLFSSCLYVFVV